MGQLRAFTRRILWLAALLVGASAAAEAKPHVLILHADTAADAGDMQSELVGTGQFDVVDTFDMSAGTVTASQLANYDAVLLTVVFNPLLDSTTDGNVLADYVDAGHGVVSALWNSYANVTTSENIGGRFAASYFLIQPTVNYQPGSYSLGTIHDPTNPIMKGVSNVVLGATSYHMTSFPLLNGAVSVADWNDGSPLVVTGMVNGHKRVDVNFYPSSSSTWGGYTLPSDIPLMVANALSYVAGVASNGALTPSPMQVSFPDTGVGSTAATQTLTLTNGGTAAVTVTALALGGANPGDFSFMNALGLPLVLQPGAGFPVTVGFAPMAPGMRAALLQATVSGVAGMSNVLLSGNGLGPKVVVTPPTVAMGGLPLGMAVPPANVTVANNGGGQLHVTGVTLGGTNAAEFGLTGLPMLPTTLASMTSFPFSVTFTPTGAGAASATITIASDDPNNPMLMVPVTATAGPPAIALDQGSLVFAATNVGATSMASVITVSNTGFSDLAISGVTLGGANPGDFTVDKTMLPSTIHPGMNGMVSVTFAPTMPGSRTATLSIASNDPTTPTKSVTLVGTATTAMLSVMPTSIDFGSVLVGATSTTKTVMVNNTGTGALKLNQLAIAGPQAASFSLVSPPATPLSIAAGASATLSLTCSPTATGAGQATLTITADVGMQAVMLACTGIAPSISVAPTSLTFPMIQIGTSAPTQAVMVSNTGTAPLHLTSYNVYGAYANDFPSANAPAAGTTIDPGQSISFDVGFTPSADTAESATIQIACDDPKNPIVSINVMGAGAQRGIQVTPLLLDFGKGIPGVKKTLPVMIANTGDLPLAIGSLALGGTTADDFSVDNSGPIAIDVGQSATVNVTFTPMAVGDVSATLDMTPMGLQAVTVQLQGGAVNPITAAPTFVDFGQVVVAQTGSATITVHNAGGSPVALGAITASNPNYTIDKSSTGAMIGVGGKTTFTINFTPAAAGTFGATVSVALAGESTGLATITVTGIGVAPAGGGMGGSMPGGCSTGGPASRAPAASLAALALLLLALASRRRCAG